LLAKGGKITMPVLPSVPRSFSAGVWPMRCGSPQQRHGRHRAQLGHWIMEENPQATIKLVTDFLAK